MSEGTLSIPQYLDSAMYFWVENFITYCLSVAVIDNRYRLIFEIWWNFGATSLRQRILLVLIASTVNVLIFAVFAVDRKSRKIVPAKLFFNII